VIMTRKEELVKEYDHLEKELTEVDKRLNDMRSSAPTKESLIEYDSLRNKSKQLEKRMSEIITEITQLLKDKS